VHTLHSSDHSQKVHWQWGIYVCTSCGGAVTAGAFRNPQNNQIIGPVIKVFPSIEEVSDAIPARAKHFLENARDTIHAASASIMASASAVDAMLKALKYRDGNLYQRINKAAEDHLITQEMASWAHEVRLDANDQRHADDNSALPTEEDAKRALDFAMALAEILFILPARVKRGRSQPGNPPTR
jgi:hypothetical protein